MYNLLNLPIFPHFHFHKPLPFSLHFLTQRPLNLLIPILIINLPQPLIRFATLNILISRPSVHLLPDCTVIVVAIAPVVVICHLGNIGYTVEAGHLQNRELYRIVIHCI